VRSLRSRWNRFRSLLRRSLGDTMKLRVVRLLLLAGVVAGLQPGCVGAQDAKPVVAAPVDTGCCGVITPAGAQLVAFLDSLNVDHLWTAHEHIDWETGEPTAGHGHEPPTHCSAFAAAAGKKLGIYMLRPPEHPQNMLSEAQEKWFESDAGREGGWKPVSSPKEAQVLANQGEFVVLVFGRERGSGHIAIVRPAVKSDKALADEGPQTTQAGGHNFSSGTAKYSFVFHPGVWPSQVKMFAHVTRFEPGAQ